MDADQHPRVIAGIAPIPCRPAGKSPRGPRIGTAFCRGTSRRTPQGRIEFSIPSFIERSLDPNPAMTGP